MLQIYSSLDGKPYKVILRTRLTFRAEELAVREG